MPVEVIKALLLVGVPLEELGEMTELIGLRPRYVARFIGNISPRLKQAAYQDQKGVALSGELIDDDA